MPIKIFRVAQGRRGETGALKLKLKLSLYSAAANDISSQTPDWQICHTTAGWKKIT